MLKQPKIGILMRGDMGHGIAKVLIENNFKVFTFLKGRSERTKLLAKKSKIKNVNNLKCFLNKVDIVLSIIPPQKAFEQATTIAKHKSEISKEIT